MRRGRAARPRLWADNPVWRMNIRKHVANVPTGQQSDRSHNDYSYDTAADTYFAADAASAPVIDVAALAASVHSHVILFG